MTLRVVNDCAFILDDSTTPPRIVGIKQPDGSEHYFMLTPTQQSAVSNAGLAALMSTAFGGVPVVQAMSQQSTDYTLALTDAGTAIRHNSASPHSFTIPPNADVAFPIGTRIKIVNTSGGGTLTILRGSGVTLHSSDGSPTNDDMTLSERQVVELMKYTTNVWTIEGGYSETP